MLPSVSRTHILHRCDDIDDDILASAPRTTKNVTHNARGARVNVRAYARMGKDDEVKSDISCPVYDDICREEAHAP